VTWKVNKLKELTESPESSSQCTKAFTLRVTWIGLGRRGLMNCEETIRIEENNLGWYFKNSNDSLP